MIKAVMVMNTQGKSRLAKFYEYLDSRLVYKHFATLYFVFVFDSSENELAVLDLIQDVLPSVFVETLDKCFQNVCELDIVFNYSKVVSSLISASI
ncbi:hypothetical protein Goarm_006273 [Gossypium armourianum]|uniref:AP complex subunit sigma n=1 Tax=Gossypium armourianum TaxID=34283 RepID=A0A7J9JHH1_9ROSI|nr:hypothetical protein [Gossypium armourianum]